MLTRSGTSPTEAESRHDSWGGAWRICPSKLSGILRCLAPPTAETPPAWVPFFDGYANVAADAGHKIADSLTARFGTAGIDAIAGRDGDVHEALITHAYPIAWLMRDALEAPPQRWLGLNSANTALTVIEHRFQLPPTIIMFNDMGHLPPHLQWTGFPDVPRP